MGVYLFEVRLDGGNGGLVVGERDDEGREVGEIRRAAVLRSGGVHVGEARRVIYKALNVLFLFWAGSGEGAPPVGVNETQSVIPGFGMWGCVFRDCLMVAFSVRARDAGVEMFAR